MQRHNNRNSDYTEQSNSSIPQKPSQGIIKTKAPSLDMIRNEVKAALYKVSSSVDLGKNHKPISRQSLIKHVNNDSTFFGGDENIRADFG